METVKLELIKKIEEKGLSVAAAAEKAEFNPMLLGLYFAKDAYPVPKRILDKIEKAIQ